MNRAYRLVWNGTHKTWVVASELAKSMKRNTQGGVAVASTAILALMATPGYALDEYKTSGGNWSTDANWTSGTRPTPGNSTQLSFLVSPQYWNTVTNDLGSFTLNSLALNNDVDTINPHLTVNGGTLIFDGTAPTVSATGYSNTSDYQITINSDVILNQTLSVTHSVSGGSVKLSGNVSGTGGIHLQKGSLSLTGSTDYSGNTTVDSGAYLTAFSNANSALTVNGDWTTSSSGTIGSLSGAGSVRINSSGATIRIGANNADTTFSGTIQNSGTIEKIGSGTLTLSGTSSGTGSVIVSNGRLLSDAAGAFNNNVSYTVNGGTLDLNGNNLSVNKLSGSGGQVSLGSATLTVNQSANSSYAGTLTGSGDVVKSGSGTLSLTGNNNYTGGTTVTAGTLRSGASGAFVDNTGYTVNGGTLDLNGNTLTMSSLSGTGGEIKLGGTSLTINQSSDTSFAGTISGNGSLTKSGGGTLTLSGNNNYTSGTTLLAGTLSISSDNNLGDSSGSLTLNNGTLQTTADITSSRTTVIALNGGTFDTTTGTTLTHSGALSGSYSLTKTGGGTLVLSGNNSYNGDVTLDDGTLSIDGGSIGDNSSDIGVGYTLSQPATLNIANGGNVTAGTLTTGMYTNSNGTITISGTGSNLTVNDALFGRGGDSTVTVSDGASLSSPSTIRMAFGSSSTSILNIGTGGQAGNLTNVSSIEGLAGTARVNFNHSNDISFAPLLTGNLSLSKTGPGITTLTANNNYTGTTTINGGTLRVNGSNNSSSTTVNSGGTLGGSGTVGSVTVNTGGTIAPGNSIGTLNIAGDITFASGGTYQVEVDDAGNADRIVATGTANLNGASVQVQAASGNYANSTDYTILTAGSINGTFGSVSSNLAFMDPTLRYDATNVYLNLTRNDIAYGDVASTGNQRAVGDALTAINNAGASGDMQTLIKTVNKLTASGARQAYDSLSGVQHSDAQSLLLGASGRFTGLLNARANQLAINPGATARQQAAFTPIQLAYNGELSDLQLASNGTTAGLMENSGSGFWLTPQGGTGSIDSSENASGANYTWYGLYGGADKWLDNRRLVGFALGVSNTDANPSAGDINLDSMELAAYGRWQDDKRYLDASLTAGRHRTDSARRVSVGSLTRTASADYDSRSLGLSVEAGQTAYEQDDKRIAPFIGLRYARLSRDGFTETGAGSANLVVDSDTQESLQGRLGVRTEQHSESTSGRRLDWDLSVAWAREFRDTTSTLNAGFEGAPSTTFSVDGPQLDRNRIQLGVGLTTDIGKATTLRIGYNGELAGSDQNHSASASFRVSW